MGCKCCNSEGKEDDAQRDGERAITDLSQGRVLLKVRDLISRSPPHISRARRGAYRLALPLLWFGYWLAAQFVGTPGLYIQRRLACLGIRLKLKGLFLSKHVPPVGHCFIDTFRYFEHDFVSKALRDGPPPVRALDVSSPRLLSFLMALDYPDLMIDIVNPDATDIDITRLFVLALGLEDRCRLHAGYLHEASLLTEAYDLVTCISVLEHVPQDNLLVSEMWRHLRPGGRMILTVPCAAESYLEYSDVNVYGLLPREPDGSYFFQRYYDNATLAKSIHSVTGPPKRVNIWGERKRGIYDALRWKKLSKDRVYPSWKEPWVFGRGFRPYKSIDDLPGIGVVAMEFIKTRDLLFGYKAE